MYYFILVNNQQQGPYSVSELRSRALTPETLVWAAGMEQWRPACQVDELRVLFQSAASGAPEPPHQQPADAQGGNNFRENDSQYSASSGQYGTSDGGQYSAPSGQFRDSDSQFREAGSRPAAPARHRRHSGCAMLLGMTGLVIVAMFVGLVITCPTPDKHREAVTEEVNRIVERAADSNSDAWGMLGNMIASRLVGVVIDHALHVDNYMVCSVGRIHYKGKDKTVSFGILNHVFTFDADDIERAMKQGSDAYDHYGSPSSPDDTAAPDDTPVPDDDSSAPDGGTSDDGTDEPDDTPADGVDL